MSCLYLWRRHGSCMYPVTPMKHHRNHVNAWYMQHQKEVSFHVRNVKERELNHWSAQASGWSIVDLSSVFHVNPVCAFACSAGRNPFAKPQPHYLELRSSFFPFFLNRGSHAVLFDVCHCVLLSTSRHLICDSFSAQTRVPISAQKRQDWCCLVTLHIYSIICWYIRFLMINIHF